jgi:hypothetical protein
MYTFVDFWKREGCKLFCCITGFIANYDLLLTDEMRLKRRISGNTSAGRAFHMATVRLVKLVFKNLCQLDSTQDSPDVLHFNKFTAKV